MNAAERAAATAAKLGRRRDGNGNELETVEEVAESMAKFRASQRDDETLAQPLPASNYVRTTPITTTFKVPPARHAALLRWETDASVQLGITPGRNGVTNQMVYDAMLAVLLTDESTSRRVLAKIRENLPTRRAR
jgi:hypothetical protein